MPSSVVHTMRYDPDSRTLRIIFVSGMVYDYLNVPEKVYEEMKGSGSKGTFLNQRIKTKFPFRKVE
jgi:hypothetical protein